MLFSKRNNMNNNCWLKPIIKPLTYFPSSMKINYNNKTFRPVQNTENGETTTDTIFKYEQKANIITSVYSGGKIVSGHLIGLVDHNGNIEMRYHQVNTKGELMTGICQSIPQLMPNGKLRLYEDWRWTSGNKSKGKSILEEIWI